VTVAVEHNPEVASSWFPVLLYHRIVPKPISPDPYHNCVTTAAFRSHLEWLKIHGYTSTSLTDSSQLRHIKSVGITFDDGYEDNYVHALPLLRQFGFTATVFVVTDAIGGVNDFDMSLGAAPARMLRPEQIRELHRHGFQIGSHSCSHPPSLIDLGDAQLRDELVRSRAVLGDLIQAPVNTFSYPHSRVDQRTEIAVQDAGYDLALAGEGSSFARYRMHRIFAPPGEGAALAGRLRLRRLKRLIRGAVPRAGVAQLPPR
jgi:peptidoglycan/xylan/chitin deacetylase (PgdA/CDA1 family)